MNPIFEENFLNAKAELNAEQAKAVELTDGPVMVIAGPGTGKTQLLSTRICHIVSSTHALASNILCLTYTNAGVAAIRKRLESMLGPEAQHCTINTFHGFSEDLFQRFGNKSDLQDSKLIDELTTKKLVRRLLDEVDFGTPLKDKVTSVDEAIRFVISLINLIKKENLDINQMRRDYENEMKAVYESNLYRYKKQTKDFAVGDMKQNDWIKYEKRIQKHIQALGVCERYHEEFEQAKYRDFHSSISRAIDLINTDPDVRFDLLEQYQYVMIDEFQDTNGAQLGIVNAIFAEEENPNIMIVGDEDQAIFKFQGANLKNIFDFYDHYIKQLPIQEQLERIIILNKNYRSTTPIVESSKELISHGSERITGIIEGRSLSKDFVAGSKELKDVKNPVLFWTIEEKTDLYIPIANQIEQLVQTGQDLSEIAVLFPGNKEAQEFSQYLDVLKIPYRLSKSANLLEDEFSLQLMSLLRLVSDFMTKKTFSNGALSDLMMAPWNGLTIFQITKFWAEFSERKANDQSEDVLSFIENYTSDNQIQKIAAGFRQTVKSYKFLPLDRFFHHVLDQFQIKEWALVRPNRLDLMQKFENLYQWILEQKLAYELNDMASVIRLVDDFIKEGITIPFIQTFTEPNSVYLSTYHSSKGLEWDHVFVAFAGRPNSFNDKISLPRTGEELSHFINPPVKSKKNAELSIEEKEENEEKRRLLYVAMTRAKHQLYVVDYENVKGKVKPNYFKSEMTVVSQELHQKTADIDCVNLESFKLISSDDYLKFQTVNQSKLAEMKATLFENQYVHQRIEDFQLSHSSMSTYLKCPLTFFCEKIIKVPSPSTFYLHFGNFYHQVMEKFYDEIKKDATKNSLDCIIQLAKNILPEFKSAFTEIEYKDSLASIDNNLTQFYAQYIAHSSNPNYFVEESFSAEIQGVKINGKIDKYDIHGSQVDIIDFKTGKYDKAKAKLKPRTEDYKDPENPTVDERYGGDYWRQAQIYSILMKRSKPELELNFVEYAFMIPSDNKIVTEKVAISPESQKEVEELIVEVASKIKAKKFDGCGEPECKWCNILSSESE
jgi:DNA helicase II / ATP-dependent DNA helicase PcrA